MERNTPMWIAIGVLFLATLFLTYEASSITGNAISAANTNARTIDTTGWTANEIMNYEMHGTIPARIQGGSSRGSAGSGMVGGC